MSKSRIGIICIAAFLLAMIVRAPAWLLTSEVSKQSNGRIGFSNVTGSIWNGSAQVNFTKEGIKLDEVSWQFRPLALLFLEVVFTTQFKGDDVAGKGAILLHFTSIELHEVEATSSARLLSSGIPALGVLAPEGKTRLRIYRLDCAAKRCDGDAHLDIENAALGLSELRPLGDYSLAILFKGTRADYELKTTKGTLRAAGRGAWELDKQPTFVGEISAPPDQLPKVQGFMRLFGTPDERGVLRINR